MSSRTWFHGLLALPDFLVKELAPTPERYEATIRLMMAMSIVIVSSLTLHIPMLALSLLIVFFVGQENTTLTRLSSMVMVAGSTIIIALMLLLLKFTMGEPLLRILGSCVIAYLGIYLMRISRLGIVGFGAALAAVYTQSLIDIFDSPEQLSRLILWLWIAIQLPVLVTLLVNELVFPLRPEKLLKREMTRQLRQVLAILTARINRQAMSPLCPHSVAEDLVRLHRHFEYAQQASAEFRRHQEHYLRRVLAVDRLYSAAASLAAIPYIPLDSDHTRLVGILRQRCELLYRAISEDGAYQHHDEPLPPYGIDPQFASALHEISCALSHAQDSEEAQVSDIKAPPAPLLKPDAWSNPVYAKFSLRTVLVTMAGYLLYTGLQWPGIHTVMLTCIIVALPSLGTMTHKGINRIVGCLLGSLVALIYTVFIIPELDGIVGLLLVTIPIIGFGSWIAAGSSRTAYIGHQFVFAFALAEFSQFGPVTDVTEIRDRMIGILIGVLISVVAARLIWPEKEQDHWIITFQELRKNMANMLRAISTSPSHSVVQESRIYGLNLILRCEEILAGLYFEAGNDRTAYSNLMHYQKALSKAQVLFFSITLFQSLTTNSPPESNRYISDLMCTSLNKIGDAIESLTSLIESELSLSVENRTQFDTTPPDDSPAHNSTCNLLDLVSTISHQSNELITSVREATA